VRNALIFEARLCTSRGWYPRGRGRRAGDPEDAKGLPAVMAAYGESRSPQASRVRPLCRPANEKTREPLRHRATGEEFERRAENQPSLSCAETAAILFYGAAGVRTGHRSKSRHMRRSPSNGKQSHSSQRPPTKLESPSLRRRRKATRRHGLGARSPEGSAPACSHFRHET
jgi:hypothetical protein